MQTIELGGRVLKIAPANLKSIKRWLKAQKEVHLGTFEYLEEVSIFIFETLKIEQPDLSQDWLDEQLNEPRIADLVRKIYEAGSIKSGETVGPQNP